MRKYESIKYARTIAATVISLIGVAAPLGVRHATASGCTGEEMYTCMGAGQTHLEPPQSGYQCFVNSAGYGTRWAYGIESWLEGSGCEPVQIDCHWEWWLSCHENGDPDSPHYPDQREVDSTAVTGFCTGS